MPRRRRRFTARPLKGNAASAAPGTRTHSRHNSTWQRCSRIWAGRRKLLPPHHTEIPFSLATLGSLLADGHRPEEAEPLLRECLTIREKKLPSGDWRIASARSLLGGCLARQKRFAEAEPLLLAG